MLGILSVSNRCCSEPAQCEVQLGTTLWKSQQLVGGNFEDMLAALPDHWTPTLFEDLKSRKDR